MRLSGRHAARACWGVDRARHLLSEAEALFEVLGDQRGLADAVAWRSTEVSSKAGERAWRSRSELSRYRRGIDDEDIARWGRSLLGDPLVSRAVVDGDREAAERVGALARSVLQYEAEKSDSSSLERARQCRELGAFAVRARRVSGEHRQLPNARCATCRRSISAAAFMWPVMVIGFSACAGGEPGRGVSLIAAA